MFHGIGGPDCPAEVFESQMKYLKAHFSVIPLQEALTISGQETRDFSTEIVLTFDDGLRNNYTIAYPVLKRYELPATFFVCPGLIESQTWQWAYEAGERLLTCGKRDLQNLGEQFTIAIGNQDADSGEEAEMIVEQMKMMDIERRKNAEQAIRALTPDFKPTPRQHDLFDTMSWDELRDLSPELITIGSHTVNHPILTSLPSEDMRYQIQESKQWLQRRLQRPVDYFCYPNGEYDGATAKTVADNYKAAVSTKPGFFQKGDDVFAINRIPAPDSLPLFAWRMFRP